MICHQDTKVLRKKKTWCLRTLVAKRKGVTLTEMMVVIGIAALMLGLAIPTANVLLNSFESESGAKSIINGALASSRAIAAKEQRYAGIRFQKIGDPNNPEKASQYIIFIINDPNVMAYGFRAVEGIPPIKLPDSIGVMDMTIVTQRNETNPINPTTEIRIDDQVSGGNTRINDNFELLDTSAFSIIFSPSGKLVIQGVRVWNRNGRTDNLSYDGIFNNIYNVEDTRIAMFYQDNYWTDPAHNVPPNWNWGLGPEPSRNSFVIYDTKLFKQAYKEGNAYSGYLKQLKPIYINPYTGTIINEK
jgi:prepilin-type N-terminal cleavage/methylation domain-containing protein